MASGFTSWATIRRVALYDCRGVAMGTYRDESIIDLSSLSSGVYIVRLLTGNRVISGKILVP